MKVIAYLCNYEGPEALSTEAQLSEIQSYAQKYNLEIVEIMKDTQHAADLRQTSGLKKALRRCQQDPGLGFIVAQLECITKSLRLLRALVSGSLRRITLFSVHEELDTRSRAGRSMLDVLEKVSQWESEMSTLTGEESLERPKAKKKSVSKGLKKGRQLPSVTAVHKTQLREVGGEGEWWKVYGYFAGRLFKTNDEISIDQEI